MVKNSGLYPAVGVEPRDVPAMGLAGARLLTETTRVTGLGNELSRALTAWRRTWSVHDPGKITANLAVRAALGGHCLSDLSPLRCDKELFGSVASDPTVSRLVGTPADHVKITAGYRTRPGSAPDPVEKCWCAPMGPEAQRRPLSSSPTAGCPTAWGSRCQTTRRKSTGTIPETTWTPAYNADGQPRQGTDIAETRRPTEPDRLAGRYAAQPCAETGPTRAPSCASRTSGTTGPPPSPPSTRVGQLADLKARHRLRARRQGLSLKHISEPPRLRRSSYAVFCLKKKKLLSKN